MAITLAFDVYGTLIDTQGVIDALAVYLGDAPAREFSRRWRAKQLEYSFRRGLMQRYESFSCCTKDSFHYVVSEMKLSLNRQAEDFILSAYGRLPAFPDVRPGLTRVRDAGFRLFAFSNGAASSVDSLLSNAGIREFFEDVVSADEVRSFKPNPEVYRRFLERSGSNGADAWLISSNPFDVIGAISSGMRAAWVRRSPDAVFDPWWIAPTITVNALTALAQSIPQGNPERQT